MVANAERDGSSLTWWAGTASAGCSDPAGVARVGGALPRGLIVLRRRPKEDWAGVLRRFDVGGSRRDGSPQRPDPVPALFGPPASCHRFCSTKMAGATQPDTRQKPAKNRRTLSIQAILVNAGRSDASNSAAAACGLPRRMHKSRTRSIVSPVPHHREMVKAQNREH